MTKQQTRSGFAVVGIGASAGGLEAFKRFFDAMPDDTGMAFVLIQHLDPTHQSLTAELLRSHTGMTVVEVEDEMRVEPNNVYVIPPNRYLTISGERLHLTAPVERRGVRVPIDFFLRSLADDQQERGVAVILSGAGSDGMLGVREIKVAGGMVVAQDPRTAEYNSMPNSALETGVVDHVLTVEQMPEILQRYVRHWYVKGAPQPPARPQKPDELTAILGLLRARVKYDFHCYKKGTLTRRIERRMGLRHIDDMAAYLDLLREESSEVMALYKDLLIGVTNFFREPDAWRELEREVIAPLVRGHSAERPIRVWVPGCATGEEAYSIAMLLVEQLDTANMGCDIHIFASDIDADALAFARAGVYAENIAADVSPERIRRFFVKGEHTYRINKDIRDIVVFAEQNLISDPPFSKLDLISCRNLMIYLEPQVQKKIMAMFHFALREGGFLFLGNAETIGQQTDLYDTLSRKWRIYRRIGPVRHYRLDMAFSASDGPYSPPALPDTNQDHRQRRLATVAQHALLQRFAPACVLIDRNAEVVYLHGPVDDYLQLPSGELAADIYAMARSGLRTKLRAAVQQVEKDDKTVVIGDARVKRDDDYHPNQISVEPLREPRGAEGLLLVTFEEAGTDRPPTRVIYIEPPEPELADKPGSPAEYDAIIRNLDAELAHTREDLQTTIEELETSNEESKAANEEVTSINEELQSTNEELETSKEELQSMNEELQTVNSQLEGKIGELEATNNDLLNLVRSIDYPVLFLDRALHIKRFTPAATDMLRIIDTDIGRPFADFARNLDDPNLLADAEQVLRKLTPIESEVPTDSGRWFQRRIVPYRTEDDRIDGVVVTFADVSDRKLREKAQTYLNEKLERLVSKRTKLAQLVLEVTIAANTATNLRGAIRRAIDHIVSSNNWQVGFAYKISDSGESLVPAGIWSEAGATGEYAGFAKALADINVPLSSPLWIAEAARTRQLRWIKDLSQTQQHTPIGDRAVDSGLHGSIAFPILAGDELTALLVFFSSDPGEPDEPFVQATRNVGMQLGQAELRERLERKLVEATDREQSRFGQELHDSIGQNLSVVGMLASALRMDHESGNSPSGERIAELVELIERTNAELRNLVTGMVTFDISASDFFSALQALADGTDMTHGVSCSFHHDPSDQPAWTSDGFKVSQIYRIAQEAVHNAVKHARANRIEIRLLDGDPSGINILDDGIGIRGDESHVRGYGLTIMHYRASLIGATLKIEPRSEGGTVVACTFTDS